MVAPSLVPGSLRRYDPPTTSPSRRRRRRHGERNAGSAAGRSWVPCWALPLTNCVTLAEWLRLSAQASSPVKGELCTHLAGHPRSPSAQLRNRASRLCQGPHTHPAWGPGRPWSRSPTPTSATLPRHTPKAPPLHDSPGPAQVAPSVGLGARKPGSPRGLLIGGPPGPPSSQQPPKHGPNVNRGSVLSQQRRGSRQAPRAGAPRAPLLTSGKLLRARNRRGGAKRLGAEPGA